MAEVLNPANTEAPHKQQPKATSGGINIETIQGLIAEDDHYSTFKKLQRQL